MKQSYSPQLEAAFAKAMKAITPPRGPAMHTYEIRFTYKRPIDSRGGFASESDKERIEADTSSEAQAKFSDWFADAYQGSTLQSVSCIQVPGT